MRITSIETRAVRVNHRGDWLFALVRTDDGRVGLGEASHGGQGPDRDRVVSSIIQQSLAPRLLDSDPCPVRVLVASLRPLADGLAAWTALSGVEQALWDLAGQAAGLPVATLLGGDVTHQQRVYANINRATTDRTPDGFAASARAAVTEGFSAVKCAPFDGVDPLGCRDAAGRGLVQQGLDRVAAVRATIGLECDLFVDCHQRLDLPTALWVARELGALGVTWFEEPIAIDDLASLCRLRDRIDLELIGGEHLLGPTAVWPYLQAGVFGTLMPDVKHCGGISGLLAIGEMAAAAGVAVAPHNPSGPVAMAATRHAAAALPTCRWIEYAWGEVPWRADLIQPTERIVAGTTAPPVGPGLGIALNEALAAEHAIPRA
jgi:galactonate dehydratase